MHHRHRRNPKRIAAAGVIGTKSENENHEFHAMDITGVMSGPILCETRRIAAAASQSEDKKGGARRKPRAQKASEESEETQEVVSEQQEEA